MPAQELRSEELAWTRADIYPGELQKAVMETARQLFGAEREGLIVETARRMGWQRTGRKIEQALSAAIDVLLETGELQESLGAIRPPK